MVGNVLCLAVFGWCSWMVSHSLRPWLRDLGGGFVVFDDEKSGESISSAQTTNYIRLRAFMHVQFSNHQIMFAA